jgi:predicted Rossmann-fold nucleotide-binding protein
VSPIVIVNVRGFYDPLRELLDRAITERFMDERHRQMWTFVDSPEDVLAAIRAAPEWTAGARAFARPGAGPRG